MVKNLYDILGISKTATKTEIKSQYRKLARKYHPDLNKNDKSAADKFKEISAAYDILGDDEKRKKYDNNEIDADGKPTGFGAGGFGNNRSYQSYSTNGFNGGGFDFSSIFGEDIFSQFGNGGGFGRSYAQKGQDVSGTLEVDFLDAAKGTDKDINLNGKRLSVKIPAGTVSGQVLRLKGQGGSGTNGAANGDALITINVRTHKYFKSEGKNITMDLPISMKEAVLGAKIIVPTISGKVYLTIPPYSSSGEKLRIKGKGIKVGNICGDEIINLQILAPKEKDIELENILRNSSDNVIRGY